MARSPKLKVYSTAIGFHDALVAAPSQAAALKAWGTTTNLFAAGRATVVEDEGLQAEALARPGEIIKRLRGDEAAMLGPEPVAAPEPKGSRRKPVKSATVAVVRQPDRSALDAAEIAVAEAERKLAAELDALAAERVELDRREAAARAVGEARLAKLRSAMVKAAAHFAKASRKAGRGRAAP